MQGDDDFRLLSSGYNNLHHGDWSKKTILLKKGEEVKYSYSAHSDYILFAEYGFALGMPLNTDNSLDITKRIIKLFDNLETEEETDLKKSVLEANGYWGEYHLILSEGKVDVSYRTTMALALYHMKPVQQKDQSEKRSSSPRKRNKTEENPDGGWNLQPFYDLVNGITEEISAENVRQSNETLQRLCKDIEGDCNTALTHLAGSEADKTMVETLETVWRSELWFATHFSAVETEKD